VGDIFNEDFLDFISCFNETEVDYILVGGYATILHGYNRTTGDLDIWVKQTIENYSKIEKAFALFSMPLFDMNRDKFLNDKEIDVFTFGRPPVSIDNITKVKGLDFDKVFENSESREIENGFFAKVIHLNDLIKAKQASNRPKDQDDVDHLTN
jgi:hypothetical protein